MKTAGLCQGCGSEMQAADRYCRSCGKQLSEGLPVLRCKLSRKRVVVMSILSFGIYLWYWFYLTWGQYRDHTRERAYPVWHALALNVPIYGLFRTHAHMRSFNELMVRLGALATISVGRTVVAVAVVSLLVVVSSALKLGEITSGTAGVLILMYVTGVAIIAALLTQAQDNLNRYWDSVPNATADYVRIGAGEWILVVLGAFGWADALLALFVESYRTL